jgi:hypothetical protein
MPKLLIFYLTDSRRHYTFKPFLDLLCKSNRKKDWVLLVLTHDNDTEFYRDELIQRDIQYNIFSNGTTQQLFGKSVSCYSICRNHRHSLYDEM